MVAWSTWYCFSICYLTWCFVCSLRWSPVVRSSQARPSLVLPDCRCDDIIGNIFLFTTDICPVFVVFTQTVISVVFVYPYFLLITSATLFLMEWFCSTLIPDVMSHIVNYCINSCLSMYSVWYSQTVSTPFCEIARLSQCPLDLHKFKV